jgi:hypothetical protein
MVARPDERPRGKRLSCDIGGVTVALQTQDLDPVGFFVPTTQAVDLDREFEVVLNSPLGELRARVHVVHAVSAERAIREGRRSGWGVVFIGLTDDQRVWIGLTLAALARESVPLAADAPGVAPPPGARPSASRPSPPPRAPRSVKSGTRQRRQHWLEQRPQMIARLERELVAIEGKSPWALLGVEPNADLQTTHSAFLKLCKRYHPHAFARFDCAEISQMATQLFIAHKRAYTKLTSSRPPAGASKPPATSSPPSVPAATTPPGRDKGA